MLRVGGHTFRFAETAYGDATDANDDEDDRGTARASYRSSAKLFDTTSGCPPRGQSVSRRIGRDRPPAAPLTKQKFCLSCHTPTEKPLNRPLRSSRSPRSCAWSRRDRSTGSRIIAYTAPVCPSSASRRDVYKRPSGAIKEVHPARLCSMNLPVSRCRAQCHVSRQGQRTQAHTGQVSIHHLTLRHTLRGCGSLVRYTPVSSGVNQPGYTQIPIFPNEIEEFRLGQKAGYTNWIHPGTTRRRQGWIHLGMEVGLLPWVVDQSRDGTPRPGQTVRLLTELADTLP